MYTRDGMLFLFGFGRDGELHCFFFVFFFSVDSLGQHGGVMGGTARASDMGREGVNALRFWLPKNLVALGWLRLSRFVCLGREGRGGTTAMRVMYISGWVGGGGGGLAEVMG